MTPGRSNANAPRPAVLADDGANGAAAPAHQRAGCRPAPTAASQCSQRCSDLQVRQASSRARPFVLCTQTTRAAGRRRCWISGDVTSERFHGSSSVRSTSSRIGQPSRSSPTDGPAQRVAGPVQRRQPTGTATPARTEPRRAAPARWRRRGRARSASAPPAAPRRARRARRSTRMPGARRPHRAAAADHHVDAAGGRAPTARGCTAVV